VHAHVLVKVGFLGESLSTVFVVAFERSFPRVRSQVVEKVVPLAEDHVAVREVALHHPDPAFRLLVLEAEHTELLCLGDVVMIDVDVVQVDVFAKINFNILIVQNAFQEIFVSLLFLRRLFGEINRPNALLLPILVNKRHRARRMSTIGMMGVMGVMGMMSVERLFSLARERLKV
jgi:hypothetical protein